MTDLELKQKRERMLDALAQYLYSYPYGQPTIRLKWEEQDESERKPYLDVAALQLAYLSFQGVKIVDETAELPMDEFFEGKGVVWLNETGEAGRKAYQQSRDDMLKSGFQKTYPLIEEKE